MILSYWLAAYNAEGRFINRTYHRPDDTMIGYVAYTYNRVGQLAQRIIYRSNGAKISHDTYVYNRAGQRIRRITRLPDDTMIGYDSSVYNRAEQLIQGTVHNRNGSEIGHIHYTYNDAGHRVMRAHHLAHGSLVNYVAYHYDRSGNLANQTFHNFNGHMEEYTIDIEIDPITYMPLSGIAKKPTTDEDPVFEDPVAFYSSLGQNDGQPDRANNCPAIAPQTNREDQTQGDACLDRDNDSIIDRNDNCPTIANRDQTNRYGNASIGDACEDSDNDDILDINDNCPTAENRDQANLDNATGDMLGDVCDPDIDGDGRNNTDDALPRDPTEQDDTDNDTIGDNADNCPTTDNGDQANLDNATGDILGDVCDPDIDGDGRNNTDDVFPRDPTEQDDTDNDTIGDNTDNCPLMANRQQDNLDGDSDGDLCDLDYDNDGIREIRNAYQLDAARTNLSADYVLEADLNLINYTNWEPIGDRRFQFTGTFDGQNHTIGNLTSQDHDHGYIGLFGYAHEAAINNLRLEARNLSYTLYVGGDVGSLAGSASRSNISNVRATVHGSITATGTTNTAGGLVGSITSGTILADAHAIVKGPILAANLLDVLYSYSYAGGLVGDSSNSKIIDSSASLANNLSARGAGNADAGGLVGRAHDAQILNSYAVARGSIAAMGPFPAGYARAGGLVGHAAAGIITDVYAYVARDLRANATYKSYAGGLVGYISGLRVGFSMRDGNITRGYTVIQGQVSSTAVGSQPLAGGLVGQAESSHELNAVYYSARADAQTSFTNTRGASRSLLQLQCPTAPGQNCQGAMTYTGWNASLWDFGDHQTLPTLR